ncbi:hypothetical protein H696_01683 [Fonticula alba]|uniref:FAM192A/Fyv6 N-terminal domain-containing protein n=1 Tax=Fonticula alba TaxID=691883 RepID=A0A058ZCZ8_FONAL|nr:hypothetical protein H696_01683 [Fonticula alba]KCV72285.1 hypothetical protein H696_01683 [Fonticula alba]|eukprot:XP_009493863.1 hypothetical protein H696_01683 [Fonticula alba]
MVGVMDEEDISYLDSIESTRRQAAWKREDEERRQVEAFRQKATEAAVMSARVSAGLAGAEDPFEELLPADASQVLQPLGGETPPAAAATATATPGDKPTVRRPAAGKARALAGVRVKRSNGPADVLEDRPTAGCKRPRSDDPAPEGADPAPRPGGHDVATKAADSAPKAVEPGPAAGALAGLLAQYESSSSSSSSSSSEEEDGD